MPQVSIDDDTKFVINQLVSGGLYSETANYLKAKYPYVKPSANTTPTP